MVKILEASHMPQSKRTVNEVLTLQCREGDGDDGNSTSDDDANDGTWVESRWWEWWWMGGQSKME